MLETGRGKVQTFEMELRSEIGLFQEAKEYLGEMQQQFGHVVQEDYGASLRIQELEGLINRERLQFQSSAAILTEETLQEFAAIRDRADRIRLEAFEAIAAKDGQLFHERELTTDEAMKLRERNDVLITELSFAQNDAIQAAQLIHGDQRTLDIARTEEDVAVRNLTGELSVIEACLNLESAKNERLQTRVDEDRHFH